MLDRIPACFRLRAAGEPPTSTATGPIKTTSVYQTRLGLAALSWRRAAIGLSLRVDLRTDASGVSDPEPDQISLRVRPWILWKRRGSRRFSLDAGIYGYRSAEIAWDLSSARFPDSGAPEPVSGFFVTVSVEGDQILVAGDLVEEARHRTRSSGSAVLLSSPVLVSRHEHVSLGEPQSYRTSARFGGRDHEISVQIVSKDREKKEKEKERDLGMSVVVDGKRILHVRRIRWKFRGSECAEIGGGDQIRISWDLHNWLFPMPHPPADFPSAADPGRAVFVFRFEHGGWKPASLAIDGASYSRAERRSNWSDSSGSFDRNKRGIRAGKKSFRKTSSSASSSSSTSSGGGSSVLEWASTEEAQLRAAPGFTLLLYAWKC